MKVFFHSLVTSLVGWLFLTSHLVVVVVVVAQTENSNDACAAETAALESCFNALNETDTADMDTFGDVFTCTLCVVTAPLTALANLDANEDDCGVIERAICNGISTCNEECQGCDEEALADYECQWNADSTDSGCGELDCSNPGGGATAPATFTAAMLVVSLLVGGTAVLF